MLSTARSAGPSVSLSLRGIRTLPRPFPFCEYPKIAIDGSPGGYVFGDSNGDSNGVLHFSGTKYNFLKIVLKNLGFARTVISTVWDSRGSGDQSLVQRLLDAWTGAGYVNDGAIRLSI